MMMMRSLVAVLAGFIAVVALALAADAVMRQVSPGSFGASGATTSTALLVFVIVYVSVFAVAGSYLTARLAPHHPMGHALTLGAISFVISTAVTVGQWNTAPAWYHVSALALILPSAWLGGWLRSRGGTGTAGS